MAAMTRGNSTVSPPPQPSSSNNNTHPPSISSDSGASHQEDKLSQLPNADSVRPSPLHNPSLAGLTVPSADAGKKPHFGSRLSRMFSHRGSETPATPKEGFRQDKTVSPAADHQARPSVSAKDQGSYFSHKPSTATIPETPAGGMLVDKSRKESEASPPQKTRFVMLEDGTHEHALKPDRRQEKLSDMFRNMLGKKKEDNEVHQLSLMSGWVDQVKNEKANAAKEEKGGPNYASTLVEKYGKCQEIVGRGAFGIVRISHKTDAADPRKEVLFAVKEFRRRPSESPKKYTKRLTSEFCISSALRHPNIIHTLDLMKDAKGDFCEVMEYCAGGDLYTLVLAAGKLEMLEADCYFKQLMRGVEYIHEMGVAHRDLKPENLLLTTHGALKITDFGNGECFRMAWEKEAHMVAGLCGSAPYIAPEEYIDTEFDPRAVDVWACGVIFMAMRTGRHLWRVARKDEDEFYERYLEGRRDEDGYAPIESLHRVSRCLNLHQVLVTDTTCRLGVGTSSTPFWIPIPVAASPPRRCSSLSGAARSSSARLARRAFRRW